MDGGSSRWEDLAMGREGDSREVSRILAAAGEGVPVDQDALLPLVYRHLRAIAARKMAGEREAHTLEPTALVNEVCLRLLGSTPVPWNGKRHFYAAAAEAMRRILVDHARARGAAKRGGGRRGVPLDLVDLATREDPAEILAVDEALSRLRDQDPRVAEIVRLRFFAGLTEKEVAEALDLGERTVRREWLFARAWLERELGGG
jgi:RNA polymerase sigma factor (TIGR02999 family)